MNDNKDSKKKLSADIACEDTASHSSKTTSSSSELNITEEDKLLHREGKRTIEEKNMFALSEREDPDFLAEIDLITISDRPFFPSQTLPVILEKKLWVKVFKKLKIKNNSVIGVLYTDQAKNNNAAEIKNRVGTLIRISNFSTNDDSVRFHAKGIKRFTVTDFSVDKPPYKAKVRYDFDEEQPLTKEMHAYAATIVNATKEWVNLSPLMNPDLKNIINLQNNDNIIEKADFFINIVTNDAKKLQRILEVKPLKTRLKKMMQLVMQELEMAKMQQSLREKVEEKFVSHQRKAFLQQQLKEIQSQLGIDREQKNNEFDYYESKIAKFNLSPTQQEKIYQELDKFASIDNHSADYSVTKSWLDTIVSLPWNKESKDKLNPQRAKKILNKTHYGLEDVKARIVEFLAVASLKRKISGSIILLVGPPGVGKTSIGLSIAKALGRKFYRFSVGGMRDEAEIKGHRRTYIGAMPGKIVQAFKETKRINPVIMIDEIDKIGKSYAGDPASAMLEVLDPSQNQNFVDHYLDVNFDLSKALFICTANTTDSIPSVLLDRMEVITLSGYISEEKQKIAQKILWPNIVRPLNLTTAKLKITKPALKFIIEKYARESGVRNLQRYLEKVVRKSAVELLEQNLKSKSININEVKRLLGTPIFDDDKNENAIGVVTGLAWTSMGGTTLNVEARKVFDDKTRGFRYSGQLGKVMQESAQLAYSYVNSKSHELLKSKKFFEKSHIHIHVPDGATPKDGPSAGITMASSLLSLATKKKVKKDIVMTGELSLTGKVLSVGGIREKIIAARRSNAKTVILPFGNKSDFDKLPEYLVKDLSFHFVKNYEEVMAICFDL